MESSLMRALSFEQDLDVVVEVGWQWEANSAIGV